MKPIFSVCLFGTSMTFALVCENNSIKRADREGLELRSGKCYYLHGKDETLRLSSSFSPSEQDQPNHVQVAPIPYSDNVLRNYDWDAARGTSWTVAFNTLDAYVDLTDKKLSGYLAELWSVIANHLGVKCVFVLADGVVGRNMLRHGLADVYLAPIVISMEEDRLHLGYTQPVVTHWYHLFVKTSGSQVSADFYIRAMTKPMWVVSASALLLLCFTMYAFSWIRMRVGLDCGWNCHKESIALSVLGGICSQGSQVKPTCSSLRSVLLTSFLCGYLLYNAYQSVLVSNLTVAQTYPGFSSLNEFVSMGTHNLCIRNESFAYSYVQDFPQLRSVTNRGVCEDAFRPEHLVHALCSGECVAAVEISSVMRAAFMAHSQLCDRRGTRIVRHHIKLIRSAAALLLRPNFTHYRTLDYIVTRCREIGIMDYLERKYFGSGDDTGSVMFAEDGSEKEKTLFVHVSVEHIKFVLYFYACFLSVPLSILALEILFADWKSRHLAKLRNKRRR